ncbi:hypothetical protein ABBQ38_013215 [Trebouxia sp. C0009 RCD-2024]
MAKADADMRKSPGAKVKNNKRSKSEAEAADKPQVGVQYMTCLLGARADPAPTAAPSAGQTKIALPGQAGMEAAGEQAAVGTGGEGLARQPMLPQPAGALPADFGAPGVPADQSARKRRKKQGALHVSGSHMKKKCKKKRKKEGKKQNRKGEAAPGKAETGGDILQPHSHTVEAMDDGGMLGDRPKAQAAVPHLKPLEAQPADPSAETAPQTSQELTLQTWGCCSGGGPTHTVASRAQEAPSDASQDAPNLQAQTLRCQDPVSNLGAAHMGKQTHTGHTLHHQEGVKKVLFGSQAAGDDGLHAQQVEHQLHGQDTEPQQAGMHLQQQQLRQGANAEEPDQEPEPEHLQELQQEVQQHHQQLPQRQPQAQQERSQPSWKHKEAKMARQKKRELKLLFLSWVMTRRKRLKVQQLERQKKRKMQAVLVGGPGPGQPPQEAGQQGAQQADQQRNIREHPLQPVQLKDCMLAESSRASLEAQPADQSAETAPQTSQEFTLQTAARSSGSGGAHGVAGPAKAAPSQPAPPPAALCAAPNLQAYETGAEITPDKRTQPVPYTASIGRWEEVDHMEGDDPEGYAETYRPGDSAFVLGKQGKHPYVCGEPLCLACGQKSKVQEGLSAYRARLQRGADMVECERCLGAMHLLCESPPLDAPPQGQYLCPGCKDGTRHLDQNLFKARPGRVPTIREDLLSGAGNILLGKIVTLYRHYNTANEAELVYQADIQWYEFAVNEVLLRAGKRTRMSCATFVRKAFVSSTPDANMVEVVAQQVDLDDVLYCSKLFRHAGREVLPLSEAVGDNPGSPSSTHSDADSEEGTQEALYTHLEREYDRGFRSQTDSDDDDSDNYSEADEDYMPESPLALERSCSQSEEGEEESESESESEEEEESEDEGEGEEESEGLDDAEDNASETHSRRVKHGGAKGSGAARKKRRTGTSTKKRQKCALPVWTQMPSTQDAELEPEMLAQARSLRAFKELQQRHPLGPVAMDLHPDRPWDDLLGRHEEYGELLRWVVSNPDREDRLKFVLGPAGCGKTLAANYLLDTLGKLQAEDPKLDGWHFIRLDVKYTKTLPQFSKLLFQAIFGDVTLRQHLEKLDEVFAGEQSDVVVNRVVLVIDNFDQLAAHCKQALIKLAEWRRHHKLHIIALSCEPVNLPFELEVLGPKCRYTSTACLLPLHRTKSCRKSAGSKALSAMLNREAQT